MAVPFTARWMVVGWLVGCLFEKGHMRRLFPCSKSTKDNCAPGTLLELDPYETLIDHQTTHTISTTTTT